ncbi:MFS transporter [Dactylosporangium sp. NPDC051484]|uniref:MFS transporter n=1 Tax=Dactylosporangium sp. NPDC051484 TaxID=3154942 RepID=UPI00344C6E5C
MAQPSPAGAAAPAAPAPESGISRSMVLLMAFAVGAIVADLYYVQPLLPDLSADLGGSADTVGLSVTVTQLGYAAGLILLVPLGDLLANRALVVGMLTVGSVALAATAAAPGPLALLLSLAVVGLSSTAINVLIQLAASLARDHERGRVVGTLMTGLFLGVLLARTVAGAVGELAGWRAVYILGAVLIAALAVALRVKLPALSARGGSTYPRLLTSVVAIVRREPFLRRRMAFGFAGFAAFQLLWTSLPFLLSGDPYRYSSATIGLFGLVGAAGVLCAQVAGRLLDRGLAHPATGVLALCLATAWALAFAGRTELIVLVIGIVLLDIGVQGVHVLNQTRIYVYEPAIRARVTTAYMTAYFLGGAFGGGLAVSLVPRAGWAGVCIAGGALAAVTTLLWLTDRRVAEPAPPQ